jgi:hypothetical protein
MALPFSSLSLGSLYFPHLIDLLPFNAPSLFAAFLTLITESLFPETDFNRLAADSFRIMMFNDSVMVTDVSFNVYVHSC